MSEMIFLINKPEDVFRPVEIQGAIDFFHSATDWLSQAEIEKIEEISQRYEAKKRPYMSVIERVGYERLISELTNFKARYRRLEGLRKAVLTYNNRLDNAGQHIKHEFSFVLDPDLKFTRTFAGEGAN